MCPVIYGFYFHTHTNFTWNPKDKALVLEQEKQLYVALCTPHSHTWVNDLKFIMQKM